MNKNPILLSAPTLMNGEERVGKSAEKSAERVRRVRRRVRTPITYSCNSDSNFSA